MLQNGNRQSPTDDIYTDLSHFYNRNCEKCENICDFSYILEPVMQRRVYTNTLKQVKTGVLVYTLPRFQLFSALFGIKIA